jgi:hypothetical protein
VDGADIPIEVALSIVLAAAVQGADRQSLLSALTRPAAVPPVEPVEQVEPVEPVEQLEPAGAPALVYAFPAPADADPDDDGPFAA